MPREFFSSKWLIAIKLNAFFQEMTLDDVFEQFQNPA